MVTTFGELHETAPRIYQQVAGQQVAVDGRFRLKDRWSYSFEVGKHDTRHALIVDPTLLYSTFLGGSAGYVCCYPGTAIGDNVAGIAVDGSGDAYVIGDTGSADFPTTVGAYSATRQGGGFGFITKLNPAGAGLVYSTYFGNSTMGGIAVNAAGHAYVTGFANPGFPTTPTAYWPTDSQHQCACFKICMMYS